MQKIFTLNSARHLGLPSGKIQIGRFPGGEISLSIKEDLNNSDVFLIGSTNAPAENLVELILAIDTVYRLHAKSINVIIPYFGYSRADREKFAGDAVSAEAIAKAIESVGKGKLKTYSLDIHSKKVGGFFKSPFKNIPTTDLFVGKFLEIGKLTVVAPDKGAAERAIVLADKIGMNCAIMTKERTEKGEVVMKGIKGKVTQNVLIFDDIVDSGETILKATEFLKKYGVREIYVAATHMVWHGEGYKLLSDSPKITKIFTTNTIEPPVHIPKRVEIISINPLLKSIIEHPSANFQQT